MALAYTKLIILAKVGYSPNSTISLPYYMLSLDLAL